MRQSLKEYITSLGRWGWLVVVDIIFGIAGAYLDISETWGFPTWLWVLLLGIALIIIPFLAFHKVRKERDQAKGNVASIVEALKTDVVIVANEPVMMAFLFWQLRDLFLNGIDPESIFPSVTNLLPEGNNAEWNQAASRLISRLRIWELVRDDNRSHLSKGYVVTITTEMGAKVLRNLESYFTKR